MDERTGIVRSWHDPGARPVAVPPFAPFAVARRFLAERWQSLGLDVELRDLRERVIVAGVHAVSVRFNQTLNGVDVEPGEVIVNVYRDGRIYSLYNQYDPGVARDIPSTEPRLAAAAAVKVAMQVARLYAHRELARPRLLVYRYARRHDGPPPPPRPRRLRRRFDAAVARVTREAPAEGRAYLVWEVGVRTWAPRHEWRVLVDAITGGLLDVRDRRAYATPAGKVFDPNPVISSGDLGLSSRTPVRTLNAQRRSVTLARLDGSGHLDGEYVEMENLVAGSSVSSEPASTRGRFEYGAATSSFLFVMAYSHIDRFQAYVRTTLGLGDIAAFPVKVDPVDASGWDDSSGAASGISFGSGKVNDASDGMVILHEYGHVIQDAAVEGSNVGNYVGGVSEGFADFLPAVYFDECHASRSAPTRGLMFSWNTNVVDYPGQGRRYDVAWHFDEPPFTTDQPHRGYIRGQLWCASLFELYRKLGGDSAFLGTRHAARDLTIRLHLAANFHVPAQDATCTMMAQEIEAAAGALAGWRHPDALHAKIIAATFARRRLPGYRGHAVDVYIDDGRDGGYGSPSGQDGFTEVLWQDAFWETEDIWTRDTPYLTPAAQAAGSPADHVPPVAARTAFAYVRVKCRAAVGAAGPVTVRLFRAPPAAALRWPTDWTATGSVDVPGVPAGGAAVAGPFSWMPADAAEPAWLAVVESAEDPALTQTLAPGAAVAEADLVSADNNIARRNVATFALQGSTVRRFVMRNPHGESKRAMLHASSTLPAGWRWSTTPRTGRRIALAAGAQASIEVRIDQARGAAIPVGPRPRPALRLSVTLDDTIVGGFTLRAASAPPAG